MKISNKEFKRFCNACEKLCQLFGLQEYSRTYRHANCNWYEYAGTDWLGTSGFSVRFSLAKTVKSKGLYGSPELCAVHEVGHLLLDKLSDLAKPGDRLEETEEATVRRFENAIRSMLTPEQFRVLGD